MQIIENVGGLAFENSYTKIYNQKVKTYIHNNKL